LHKVCHSPGTLKTPMTRHVTSAGDLQTEIGGGNDHDPITHEHKQLTTIKGGNKGRGEDTIKKNALNESLHAPKGVG